jgi:anhydro-N-acetylmuramic acid kinase
MKQTAVGIMSGTSLDGIDVVVAEVERVNEYIQINQLAFQTFPYPRDLLDKVKNAIESDVSIAHICSLNIELSHAYADCVLSLLRSSNIPLKDIDFVSSHGQTMFHITEDTNHFVKSTLQLGDGPTLANKLQTTVINNFRTADMVHDGQGAPLVPYVDFLLFKDKHKNRALLNIGGISNITVIPKQALESDVKAFDIGPGNMMIDDAMSLLFNQKYDDKGQTAKKGHIHHALLEELNIHSFIKLNPPKSTGREQFGRQYTKELIKKYEHIAPEDIIHTFTMFSAISIAESLKRFVEPHVKLDELFISGGGVHNLFLMEKLQVMMPSIDIKSIEALHMSSDAKEAIAFLILGFETLHMRPNNLPSATGATKKTILGQVSYYI